MRDSAKFTIVNIGTLSMNRFWGEEARVRTPSATCTLLTVSGKRVLVDPSPFPEQLEALLFATTGLHPAAIDQVFITHFHGDHRFGLDLFPDAEWLMASAGLDEWQKISANDADVIARFRPAEGRLLAEIQLLPAPGHTLGLNALLVDTPWGKLVIAGDAVMTPEFFAAEQGFHNSVDFAQATKTIRKIKETAALVIPGHGNIILC